MTTRLTLSIEFDFDFEDLTREATPPKRLPNGDLDATAQLLDLVNAHGFSMAGTTNETRRFTVEADADRVLDWSVLVSPAERPGPGAKLGPLAEFLPCPACEAYHDLDSCPLPLREWPAVVAERYLAEKREAGS